jgi:autotransporter-associated beta strand protein
MHTKFSPRIPISSSAARLLALLVVACGILSAQAQVIATHTPDAWVNDPYTPNTAWGINAPNTSSPTYTNNGVNFNNNLYGYSPIGTTITLTQPGQTATLTAQVTLAGTVNNSGNVQFRFGLVYRGASANDTDWAGTLIANATANGASGLYLENIPNTSIFSTGGSATVPGLSGTTFAAGWGAATFNYTLSVTYLSASANLVRWTLQGISGDSYVFAGRYTNTTAATQVGFSFDTVGFLKGGAVFTGNSTANAIGFSNVQVTLGNFGDGTWANDASGNWSATNNWVNGVAANGSGFIGDFSEVALTADRTATLDTSRNIGALLFGAASGSTNNWILNSSGGSTLSLNNNGLATVPTITVKQNTATLDLSVDSTNGLAEAGAGTLVLAGANTLVGPLDLNGGELNFSSLSNLPLGANDVSSITFGGGALQWGSGNTVDISAIGIPISFAGNAGFDTGANNVTFADGIGDGGPGEFTKLGTGTLTLDSSVYYTGGTAINSGVLALGSSGSISSTTNITILSGVTFNVSAVNGGAGLALNQNLSGTGTVIGNISDSPGITIASGTTAAGTLTVNGNLSLNGSGNLSYALADVTAAGGGTNDLIDVTGNLDIAGPTTLNVNLLNGAPGLGTYTLFTYGTFSGSIANLTAPLGFSVVNNTSAKTIGLLVTHVPQTLIWAGDGTANIWDTDNTANWLDSGSPADFFTGDSVTFTDTGSDNPPINIDVSVTPASVTVNAAQSYDFAGTGAIITGKLIKTNSGTLFLENNNSYAGPTVISGGTLQVGGPTEGNATGSLGTGIVTNNALLVFDLSGDYAMTTNIYGTGSISNLSSGEITLSGNISGSGSVTMAGSGDLFVSGSNSYTGQTIVSSGVLHPENASALGSGAALTSVSNGAQLYIDANVNITNRPLSLAGTGPASNGALRKGGAGVTYFGGLISLSADTQFQVDGNSTLYLTNPAGITASGMSVIVGADAGGAGTFTGPLNLGTGSLTSQDAGTWTIAPVNTYTGGTFLNGGTLDIAAASALGPISTFNPAYVTFDGGTLGVTTNVTFSDGLRGFTFSGAGTFDVAAGATLTISNQITGSGTLTKMDAGTLVLSGSNSFNGTLDVDTANNVNNDGTVIVTSSGAIANVLSPIAIQNNLGGASTFELDGTNGDIVVTQDFTLSGRSPAIPAILNAAGTNTMAGNLTSGGSGGRYTIESESGLLTLGSSGTLLTFNTTDPQTYTFEGSGSILVLGVIADGTNGSDDITSIEKDGTGGMTLGAINTYSGSTLVTGGDLNVNGTIGSGAVTVSGGTLSGTGIIGGPVNVEAAGTFAPGAPLGTLTLNNTLALAGNTSIAVNSSGASSKVVGLTSVAYGGTLDVTNVSGTLAAGATFQIFTAAAFTGNFSSISSTPGLSWSFSPTSGILSLVSTIPTTPTNMTFSVSGGNLTLSWPQSYTGWLLQAQTNAAGIGTNWVTVTGSTATNSVVIPIGQTNPAVFFRMEEP